MFSRIHHAAGFTELLDGKIECDTVCVCVAIRGAGFGRIAVGFVYVLLTTRCTRSAEIFLTIFSNLIQLGIRVVVSYCSLVMQTLFLLGNFLIGDVNVFFLGKFSHL